MGSLFLGASVLGLIALAAFVWLVVLAFKRHLGWGLAVLFLSPVSATIYAIKYWDRAKKPFLLYVTTMVASVGLAFYAFAAAGGMRMVKAAYQVREGIQNQTLTQEQAEEFMESSLDFIEKTAQSQEERQQVAEIRKHLEPPEPGSAKTTQHQDSQPLERMSQAYESQPQQEQGIGPQTAAVTGGSSFPESAPRTPAPGSQGSEHKVISPAQAKNYIGARVILTGINDVPQECKLIGVSGDTLQFERRFGNGKISFNYKAKNIESLHVLPD